VSDCADKPTPSNRRAETTTPKTPVQKASAELPAKIEADDMSDENSGTPKANGQTKRKAEEFDENSVKTQSPPKVIQKIEHDFQIEKTESNEAYLEYYSQLTGFQFDKKEGNSAENSKKSEESVVVDTRQTSTTENTIQDEDGAETETEAEDLDKQIKFTVVPSGRCAGFNMNSNMEKYVICAGGKTYNDASRVKNRWFARDCASSATEMVCEPCRQCFNELYEFSVEFEAKVAQRCIGRGNIPPLTPGVASAVYNELRWIAAHT